MDAYEYRNTDKNWWSINSEQMNYACPLKSPTVTQSNRPLTVAVSPSGWAILCMAVAATHTGMLSRWPSTVADRSILDTSRSTLGRNLHLSMKENKAATLFRNRETECVHRPEHGPRLLWLLRTQCEIVV